MAARPIDPFGAEYSYVQVAEDVERRITEGEITRKLPSERSFAEEYGVAYTTVRHAMALLRERGIIVTVHGRGTFVTPQRTRKCATLRRKHSPLSLGSLVPGAVSDMGPGRAFTQKPAVSRELTTASRQAKIISCVRDAASCPGLRPVRCPR